MIREQVLEAYPKLLTALEGGSRDYMYAFRQNVYIGVGCELKDMDAALALPFIHRDSLALAEPEEIMFDWKSVKVNIKLGRGTHRVTKLKITKPTIAELMEARMQKRVDELSKMLPIDEFPADAQLACLVIPDDIYQSNDALRIALIRKDWGGASSAYEKLIYADRIQWLLMGAQQVSAMNLDYDVLTGLDACDMLIK